MGFLYHQMPDATPEEINKAYYSCMKACHPDLFLSETGGESPTGYILNKIGS
jgi:hypothetical protein